MTSLSGFPPPYQTVRRPFASGSWLASLSGGSNSLGFGGLLERLAQRLGDRARAACADDPAVDLDHRHDLGGGARQEHLIRVEEVVAGQQILPHVQPQFR